MQFLKTAVLIISTVSAEFAPRTNNVGASLKNMFKRTNMLQRLQAAGRRLDAHDSATGPMSAGCYAACDGAEDAMKVLMTNMEDIGKGDFSSLCGETDALSCMDTTDACKDPNAADDDGGGMAMVSCACACPDLAKMEGMDDKEYCKAGNPLECISSKSECSAMFEKEILKGGSKADYEKGLELHCKSVDLGCPEIAEKLGECAGAEIAEWGSKGCEEAANAGALSAKSANCCPLGEKIVDCYNGKCIQISMEAELLKAKDASAEEKAEIDKEMAKNYEIGKVCTGTGMPASEAEVSSGSSGGDEGSSTDGASWASVSLAAACVAMIGGFLL